MINLRKIKIFFVFFAIGMVWSSQAAELAIYNNNKLVVLKERGVVHGYYSGSSNNSYISGNIQANVLCEFVFAQIDRIDGTINIQAWEKALVIPTEDRQTQGALYEDGELVVINFQQVPNGCRSRADGDLLIVKPAGTATSGTAAEVQGLHVRETGKEDAVGIRLVPMGGTVRTESGVEAVLPKWALVVLIKQRSKMSYVRYVDPATGHATKGWTLSDLRNPFLNSK